MRNRRRRPHYTEQNKREFFKILETYRLAIISFDRHEMVLTSIAIHSASGFVPKSYKRLISLTRRDAESMRRKIEGENHV